MKKWNREQFLNKIQTDSKVPLYLWGAGNVANEVYLKLLEDGIELDGVFETVTRKQNVSETKTNRVWNGFEVHSWDTLSGDVHMIDVILGHAQYHQGMDFEKLENVRDVYYIYSPFKTHQVIDESYYNQHYVDYAKALDVFEEDYSRNIFQAYIDSKIHEDIMPILKVFRQPISFFNNDIISLRDNECYIDIGAYNGDTIRHFYKEVQGKYYKIFAYEPDEIYYQILVEYIKREGIKDIYPSKAGIWNTDGRLYFEVDEQQSGKIANEGQSIEVSKLDTRLIGEPVSLIKINISGSIIECLEGAQEIIRCNRPKMIINVGVVRDALWKVPVLLKSYNYDYKFYLRFNESMASRLTLYVV